MRRALGALGRRVAESLRYKLLVLVLLPVLAVAPAAVAFLAHWSWTLSHEHLVRKVSADLTVTRDVFRRLERDFLDELEALAAAHAFSTALAEGDGGRLQDQLIAVRDTAGFDFLHLTDLQGRRMLAGEGGRTRQSPLRTQAAAFGVPAVGVEVFAPDELELEREGEGLAERARVTLVPSGEGEDAGEAPAGVERRALMVRAIAPVRSPQGTLVALLDGGVLLNRNLALVDAIRDLVYARESLPEGGAGAVSVFLDGTRVSTNLGLADGERAIGTGVTDQVRERVLGEGESWSGRGFLVHDWYIAAYSPIVDVYGRRVGMLGVAYLEAPFRAARQRALAVLVAVLLAGGGLAAWLALRGARAVFEPIERMAEVVRATQAGRRMRVGQVATGDEVGTLARQLDAMLELLEQRNHEIRQAAERLEGEVQARTRELREQNARLEAAIDELTETRRQLVVAEKLSALGELTAGVAHEINNPTAVILGNIELVRAELGAERERVDTEIGLIIEQVQRIRTITDRLLKYARSTRSGRRAAAVRGRQAVEDALWLVGHELRRKRARVERRFTDTGTVHIEPGELEQVLVNLLLNAAQAIDEGGHITVATRDEGDKLAVTVEDDGAGISGDALDRVFDPFFTEKKPGGTGLGLSVSYGIVRGYGGDIEVESEPGRGARFTVRLPGGSPAADDASAAVG